MVGYSRSASTLLNRFCLAALLERLCGLSRSRPDCMLTRPRSLKNVHMQAVLHSRSKTAQADLIKALRARQDAGDAARLTGATDISKAAAILQRQAHLATRRSGAAPQPDTLSVSLEVVEGLVDALPDAVDIDTADVKIIDALLGANLACLDLILVRSVFATDDAKHAENVLEVCNRVPAAQMYS